MTDNNDSKLEGILTTSKHYAGAQGALNQKEYANRLSQFYAYMTSTGKEPSAIPRPTVEQLSNLATTAISTERGNLVQKTEEALDEVAGKLSKNEGALSTLAIKIGRLSRDKKYTRYLGAVQNQDVDALRKIYREEYGQTKDGKPDELYLQFAYEARPDQLVEVIKSQVGKMREEFIKKNLYKDSGKKDKKGKPIMVYDEKTAQQYIIGAIGKMKGREREDALFTTGTSFAQFYEAEEAKKK
jgi:hypothetical protein